MCAAAPRASHSSSQPFSRFGSLLLQRCCIMGRVAEGMRIPGGPNRVVERAGVNAARSLFEAAELVFTEVPRDNDIGKDAYLDLDRDGVFVGEMVALQIKSGDSFRRGYDFKVPCDADHRALWRGSAIPIYGLVHVPGEETLYFANLTAWARDLAPDQSPSFCPVPKESRLNAETLPWWVAEVRRELAGQPFPSPVLDLMAADGLHQASAVLDCLAIGRTDARALKMLRASLPWLADVDATWPAIQVLSLATPHPDILWTAATRLSETVRLEVNETFRWTPGEVELLLSAPAPDMWQRGNLGQSVYMLLTADPDHEAKLETVATTTADEEIACQATLVRIAIAGDDGMAVLRRIVARAPALKNNPLIAELDLTLRDHGSVSMF